MAISPLAEAGIWYGSTTTGTYISSNAYGYGLSLSNDNYGIGWPQYPFVVTRTAINAYTSCWVPDQNQGIGQQSGYYSGYYLAFDVDERRSERLLQAQAYEEQVRAQLELDDKKRLEAKTRARELLVKHLTEEQRGDLSTKSYFLVHTKRGVYKINQGIAGNIEFLGGSEESRREKLCIHVPLSYNLPEEDHMLHQKLLLEADEATFLKIANHYPLQ